MACFSVACNNGFLLAHHNKLEFFGGKAKAFKRCELFSGESSHPFTSIRCIRFYESQSGFKRFGFCGCLKVHNGLACEDDEIDSNRNNSKPVDNRQVYLGKRGVRRWRLSPRLRPRLRLLRIRMKRASLESVLNHVGAFLRKNIRKVILSGSICAALGMCFLLLKLTSVPSPKPVAYSDLVASLQKREVSSVLLEEGSRRIYYNTNSAGEEAKKPEWQFAARKVEHDEKYLLRLMREAGSAYRSAPPSAVAAMRGTLVTVVTLWVPLMPLMWLLYRQLYGGGSPGKKRGREGGAAGVGFEDVEGVDAAKVELMEVVGCLRGVGKYEKVGARVPRGVLLVGPPGTGKTLLARAVAGEAGVPFFSVSASEFVEMFVGRGAARIRDLFAVARKASPSIVFIDELDAVGGKRGRSFNDERDQTLNQLLTEMDGFETGTKVVVIAATNRPEALDEALCRPGRFSRKVVVGEPDEEGRRKILAVHLRDVPLKEDPNLMCQLVASLTPGFVGADLANIVNESALLAARRGGEIVNRDDIMEAVERAKFGITNKRMGTGAISKELGKLFPWMPSLYRRNDDGPQGPMGYQALT